MTEEQKQQLFEVARKRLSQYQKMNEAQKSSVRPRGGIEIDYGVSIALMEIALAALNTQPINLPQSFYGVVQGGKVVMLPADDGQWLNKTTVAEAFRALEQRAEAAEKALAEQGEQVDKANALINDLREERKLLQRLAGDRGNKLESAEAKLAELAKRPPVGDFYEDGPGNWWQIGPHDKVPHVTPLFDRPAPAADLAELVPDGWKLVPVEPSEKMIVEGFESRPDEDFSDPEEWEEYSQMSGCEQAAYRAQRCWAAMLAASPGIPITNMIEEKAK